MTCYLFNGTTVLRNGHATMKWEDAVRFAQLAVRKKVRAQPGFLEFVTQILEVARGEKSETSFTWNFLRWTVASDYYRTTIRVVSDGNEALRVECSSGTSDPPEYVWQRVQIATGHHVPSAKVRKHAASRRRILRREERKRAEHAKREARKIRRAHAKVRRRLPCAPLSQRNERLTPQFRKQHVLWSEAITAVVKVFGVRSQPRRSAEQVAARELHRSLKQSGGSFAKFRRAGFTLRFDLVGGIWRGDITPLTISATKDNKHPIYRIMRAYFKDRLGFLTDTERRVRNTAKERALAVPQHIIMFRGIRFAA